MRKNVTAIGFALILGLTGGIIRKSPARIMNRAVKNRLIIALLTLAVVWYGLLPGGLSNTVAASDNLEAASVQLVVRNQSDGFDFGAGGDSGEVEPGLQTAQEDCFGWCIFAIVVAVSLIAGGTTVAVVKIKADEQIKLAQIKAQAEIDLLDKVLNSGVVTDQNVVQVIQALPLNPIVAISDLESSLGVTFSAEKTAQLNTLLKNRSESGDLRFQQSENLSQIIEGGLGGSPLPITAETISNTSIGETVELGSAIPLTPQEQTVLQGLDQSALRRFDLAPILGRQTDFTLVTEVQIADIVLDFNTDLSELVGDELLGEIDIAFTVEITDPASQTPLMFPVFDATVNLGPSGITAGGDLAGVFPPVSPLPAQGTIVFPGFNFPIAIDNVDPASTIKTTGVRDVHTFVSAQARPVGGTVVSVGGIAERPDIDDLTLEPAGSADGSSPLAYAAIAGIAAAALAVVAAGGWYARRRFRQRRI